MSKQLHKHVDVSVQVVLSRRGRGGVGGGNNGTDISVIDAKPVIKEDKANFIR